ncbi:MAG TPA: ribonuclease D [Thermoanaerobaculia bacterium]|nr:ribonuclease D [Thermoanaerobaculia bacterium]
MKWIAAQQSLDEALAGVKAAPVVAIDTEADSLHSYFDKVCLIQMSVDGEDLILDPLAKLDLRGLGPVLADPSVRKIFHGADYDLRILNRDFDFEVRNLVDTMVSAQLLGYEAVGLAALLKRHFGLELDKTHQRADWSRRPLPAALLEYAATDTRHLIELASRLEQELRALGRWEWALEEFSRLEAIRFAPSDTDSESWRRIKGSGRLERRPLAAVQRLHAWRDGIARELDRPPFKVLNNESILAIAAALPRTTDALRQIKGISAWHLRNWGSELLAITGEVAELREEELPEKTPAKPWQRDKSLERRIDKLKAVRDRFAAELHIDASILAPRHILTAVAEMRPAAAAELEAIPAMRRWQRELLATELVRVSAS